MTDCRELIGTEGAARFASDGGGPEADESAIVDAMERKPHAAVRYRANKNGILYIDDALDFINESSCAKASALPTSPK